MNSKVILLSGPPRSGKDTAGGIIKEHFGGTLEKFSGPLKAAIPHLVNVPFSILEESKDEPLDTYLMLPSFRQLQIDMSEKFMKPLYGNDVFARLLLYRMRCVTSELFIVTDCGFQIEVDAVVNTVGSQNCLLIHMSREGCTYAKDSRRPVQGVKGVTERYMPNNFSLDVLKDSLITFVSEFLDSQKEASTNTQ